MAGNDSEDDDLSDSSDDSLPDLEDQVDRFKAMLAAFPGLALTRIQYTDILQYMPDNYVKTWSRLYRYLDIDASAVLASNDAGTANRLMLDCLIQRHTVDISGFCDILESISDTTYELSSIVESLRLALDETSEPARIFKENLKICIMGQQDNELVHSLNTSGYTNVQVYGNAETVEFEDFEVWIMLPPNEQADLSNYMVSLYNNLQNARADDNLKLAIYSDLDQLKALCSSLNVPHQHFEEALGSLKFRKSNKLMVKKVLLNENFQDNLISSLNAKVLPFVVEQNFSEIVGKDGAPLVITVGMQLGSLWYEHIKKFNPPFSFASPPVRLSFTKEEGQILKTLNVKWTLNSSEVESEVFIKLEARKSFVFYRNGSFSGVSENRYEALNIVFCELNRPHYLLVVGDDSGIEEEIQQDIRIVASLAARHKYASTNGLTDDGFKDLCDSLNKHSDYKLGNYYTNEAVFTLLIAPEVDQLKGILHKKLLCCGRALTVIYSGHADSNGSWVFPDGLFSADDLKRVVQCAKGHIQHYIRIKIILNCCYGLVFADKLGDIQAFLAGLTIYLNEDTTNIWKTDEIKEYAFSKLIDCTEKSIKLNRLIVEKIARKMYEATDHVIAMKDLNVHILPYTVGPLHAQGILYSLLKTPYAQLQDSDIYKIRKTPLLHRCPTKVGNNLTPTDPQLIVFPAGKGDSTLFRWHDFNMLIDGGIYSDRPCFWETVRRLPDKQKLDVICVTHSHSDHLFGILRIFEEEALPIKVGKLYTTIPLLPSTNANKSKLKPGGTKLWRKALHHMKNGSLTAISNLVTDPKEHLVYKKFPNGDILEVFMLTPTKTNLDKAAKLLPFIRVSTLDEHNMASASLLIKCSKNSEPPQFALLTGDAPSEDIISGLKTVRAIAKFPEFNKRYSLDYVDMPHHGSKNNDPDLFLSKIKAKVCLISTNGLSHFHPDNITLEKLNDAMTSNNIENLLFTYTNKRRKGDRDLKDSFTQENERKCRFANNKPCNRQSSDCLLVKLTSIDIHTYKNDNIFS